MKTPTLKEVKLKYENAKEVRCLFDKKIYDISEYNYYFDNGYDSFWLAKEKDSIDEVCLFDGDVYAEIIPYKELTITIPLSQIDALPNNDKLGEYVRSLRNKI